MDTDSVMDRIGVFGTAQMKTVYLLNLNHIVVAFHVLVITFIGEDPGWSCPQSPGEATNPERCVMVADGSCTPQYSKNFTSIVTEWDLICDKSNFPKLSQSVYFAGFLLGSLIWGSMADKIGRKKVFFICLGFLVLSGLGYGLALGYFSFLFFRLCSGLSAAGCIISSYVLSVEVVGVSKREIAGMIGAVMFSFCFPILSVMAYFVRGWRFLSLLGSGIGLSLFLLLKIVPESPRWLLVNGRTEEARSVLADIAKGNGTDMPQGELKRPDTSSGNSGLSSLFSRPVIRKRVLILIAVWFVGSMVYYALSMSTGDLGSNRYLSFALSGLVEVPAIYLAYKLINRVGRRWTQGSLILSSGVACLLWSALYWTGNESAGVPVALFGKASVSGGFSVSYLYTAELLPTEVRNVGLGFTSVGARIGGIIAPLLLMTAELDRGIPMLLMGSLAFCIGLLSFSLPETLNQSLPDTLEELDNT